MDGMFVPSISFGMPVLAIDHGHAYRTVDGRPPDGAGAHPLCGGLSREPGADGVTVHLEACADVRATALDKIRACGMKAGLSICPETAAEAGGSRIWKEVEMILVMCVHPRIREGRSLFRSLWRRSARCGRWSGRTGTGSVDVEVDGGVYLTECPGSAGCGSSMLIVAGSAVFNGRAGGEHQRVYGDI